MRYSTGLLGLLLLAAGASATDLYKWKDAQGVTHYSESPPSGQKYESRRIDNRGIVGAAEEAAPAAESPNCTTARANLKTLAGKGPVMKDTDGDGKGDAQLDDTERANQRELAEAAIKAYCPPAGGG